VCCEGLSNRQKSLSRLPYKKKSEMTVFHFENSVGLFSGQLNILDPLQNYRAVIIIISKCLVPKSLRAINVRT